MAVAPLRTDSNGTTALLKRSVSEVFRLDAFDLAVALDDRRDALTLVALHRVANALLQRFVNDSPVFSENPADIFRRFGVHSMCCPRAAAQTSASYTVTTPDSSLSAASTGSGPDALNAQLVTAGASRRK